MPLTLLSWALGIPALKPEHRVQLFINITQTRNETILVALTAPKRAGSKTWHLRFLDWKRDFPVVILAVVWILGQKVLRTRHVLSEHIDLSLSLGLWSVSPYFSLHISTGGCANRFTSPESTKWSLFSLFLFLPSLFFLPATLHTNTSQTYTIITNGTKIFREGSQNLKLESLACPWIHTHVESLLSICFWGLSAHTGQL